MIGAAMVIAQLVSVANHHSSRTSIALGSSSSAHELMQYRWPVGPGPSSKTWPRCPPQLAHSTSVRSMKRLRSRSVATASSSIGAVKLGQPVPESNFVAASNSGAPQPAQRYVPGVFSSAYSPVKGRSVAFSRRTAYCSGVSSARHSASLFVTLPLLAIRLHRLSDVVLSEGSGGPRDAPPRPLTGGWRRSAGG